MSHFNTSINCTYENLTKFHSQKYFKNYVDLKLRNSSVKLIFNRVETDWNSGNLICIFKVTKIQFMLQKVIFFETE